MASEVATSPSPITSNATPPPGFWQREASHFPQPLSPLTRSVMLPRMNSVFRQIFSEYGMLLESVEFCEIGGRVYQRQVPLGGKERKAPPPWVMWLAARTAPSLRKRLRTNVRAVREDLSWGEIQRWVTEWRPAQQAGIADLRAVDMPALDDSQLFAHVERIFEFVGRSINIHFRLTPPGICLADLAFACQDLLGWDDRRPFDLLRGLSTASTEPARRLAVLSEMLRSRPAVRALLEGPLDAASEKLAAVDPEFASAFAAYQHEFGFRALRYEFADQTLEEVPALTLGLIRDQVRRAYDPAAESLAAERTRTAALAEARAALAGRPATGREQFERALERAQTYYPVREDNEFWTVSAPFALGRYAVRELGQRMAGRDQVANPDDAFFLEYSELVSAFKNNEGCRDLVARRRAERAHALANPGPPSFGQDPGPPPSFSALPREAAHSAKAMFWLLDRVFEPDRSSQVQASHTTLTGVAASGGSYTGPARVIMGEDEFDKIQAGDVLVCPITSPVWSVLFPSVGALVTDTGGVLSHPAIIAREYGIPAVVATGNATALLRDGQVVTVDGDKGTVALA